MLRSHLNNITLDPSLLYYTSGYGDNMSKLTGTFRKNVCPKVYADKTVATFILWCQKLLMATVGSGGC